MSNGMDLFKVTGELKNSTFIFHVSPWKLLIETNRYYEIKPQAGAVKRIYKEKVNVISDDIKHYAEGFLSCSAFCREDSIPDIQRNIVHHLQTTLHAYLNDLHLNQSAIDQQLLLLRNRQFAQISI
ncbi:hypothetical protein [Cohnella sp. WQ 127256]|uniref:hypothetical protein n=1 Tax=Cohnella sp. WQ 127256 TaxID=2938790 RepID=UPI0021173688|nr:hypothetical protein [Cohnella sp. WQ 127256]